MQVIHKFRIRPSFVRYLSLEPWKSVYVREDILAHMMSLGYSRPRCRRGPRPCPVLFGLCLSLSTSCSVFLGIGFLFQFTSHSLPGILAAAAFSLCSPSLPLWETEALFPESPSAQLLGGTGLAGAGYLFQNLLCGLAGRVRWQP